MFVHINIADLENVELSAYGGVMGVGWRAGMSVLRWPTLVLRVVVRGEGEGLTSVPQSHRG